MTENKQVNESSEHPIPNEPKPKIGERIPATINGQPGTSPLPAEEWLKDLFHETPAEQMSNQRYSHRSVIKLMESYSTHVNAGLLDKLALLEANPERGKCSICHATIWRNDAYMEEMGKSFHPICKVIERAEAAESRISVLERERDEANNWLDGRECWRCGYIVSGRDWKAIGRKAHEVRCVGCHGQIGDWRRYQVRELKEELYKRGSETAEFRNRAESAESQLSTLREALKGLTISAKCVNTALINLGPFPLVMDGAITAWVETCGKRIAEAERALTPPTEPPHE